MLQWIYYRFAHIPADENSKASTEADVFTTPLKKLDDYTSERFDEFLKILRF